MRSRHDEKAIAFFGTWAILGLYLDGWAHRNDQPETFFSPWHGVLYSGVGAAVAYFAVREYVLRKPSTVDDKWLTRGFLIFGVGAVGDFVWHEIFGIEVDLEALLSPTHLMLLTGGILMLSFGFRAARDRTPGEPPSFFAFLPTAISLTLTAALIVFFTQYFTAYFWGGLHHVNDNDIWAIHALGSVFVTNAIFMGAALFALQRWRTPFGTFALMYGAIALGVTGMEEFSWPFHVPMAVAGGAMVDALATRLRPASDRRRHVLAFGLLAPLAVWGMWLLAIQLMDGIHWPAELWTGTLYLASLEGAGLALLAFPKRGTDRARPELADVSRPELVHQGDA